MGHERVGVLPKSETWRSIVTQISNLPTSEYQVDRLVANTLSNVRQNYQLLQSDSGLASAFSFLVLLSAAARTQDPVKELERYGVKLGPSSSPLSIARALQSWIAQNADSLERSEIARAAATDAIADLYSSYQQKSLFSGGSDLFDPWRRTANGKGFCELARTFFAKLTERYLRYFLEREASAALPSLAARERFQVELSGYINKISRHAFETAKITQSFAAGWYNKNALEGLPSEESIAGFLRHALGKMREELAREELSS